MCNVGTGRARSGQDVVSAIGNALSRELEVEIDQKRLRAVDRPVLCADVANAGERFGVASDNYLRSGHPRDNPIANAAQWRFMSGETLLRRAFEQIGRHAQPTAQHWWRAMGGNVECASEYSLSPKEMSVRVPLTRP